MNNITEVKQHFDLKPCTNKLYEFVLFNRLIHVQFSTDFWSKLDSELRLNKSFIHVGTVEDIDGTKLNRIIIWKLSITCGKLK